MTRDAFEAGGMGVVIDVSPAFPTVIAVQLVDMCVGSGTTRDEAIRDAIETLEAILAERERGAGRPSPRGIPCELENVIHK